MANENPTYATMMADGYDRAVWCEPCGHYLLHRALDNDVFECAICHGKQHLPMTDREWMLKYAPHGYRYMKNRIPFEVLDMAVSPSDILSIEIDHLHRKMERETEGGFEAAVFTRVSVYPKQVGESLNHLDPLLPRLGIEIEIRQPTAAATP
jgi:hypothetical protein